MKNSQWKLNLGFSIFIILLIVLLIQVSIQLALIFILSLGLGFALQKSRFCCTSAFRDPLLVGTTKLTRALILLIAISLIGFTAVVYLADLFRISVNLNLFPMGFHTVVGGIIFGIGIVLAGGCAAGVLTRVGEGFAIQMIALLGVFLGTLLGSYSLPYWRTTFGESPGIFLPDVVGWLPAVAIQLLILLSLWLVTLWWQKKQNGVR